MHNFLENDTLKLRALEPVDLELLYTWENNPDIWEVSNTLIPYSKYILHQYIENSHKDIFEAKQIRLIIDLKISEDIPISIGTIDLFDVDFYNLRSGIGILIADKEHRNKGYAGLTIELLKKYTFDHLGLKQLYCNISEDNIASLKVFQNHGFKITGKFKNWKKSSKGWKNIHFLQLIME